MKKTLLFVALLPSILFAQIGQIQTHEKPYEFFYNGEVYRKVADDTYYLQIRSDNQFEDKAAVLTLGTGATEAMTSLGNLFALFEKDDRDFELQGYRFGLRRNGIFAYKTGPLEYSAGDFMLRKYVLPRVMADLMEKKNMPIGDVRVVYSDKYAAYIYYDTYGFYLATSFSNMTLPYTHVYSKGDVIADEDLRLMIKAAQNPNAYRTKTAQTGAMVICDKQLIKACETILNK
jgi:hypothetical protein